jgi:hypothetical protein
MRPSRGRTGPPVVEGLSFHVSPREDRDAGSELQHDDAGHRHQGVSGVFIITVDTAHATEDWAFMLTVAPLVLERVAGSPVNPIAVF